MFVLKLNISICFAKYFATYITPFMLLLQGTNYINYIQRRINLFHFAEMYFDRGNFYDFTSVGEHTFYFLLFSLIINQVHGCQLFEGTMYLLVIFNTLDHTYNFHFQG